ncbi:MAG: PepSY domain-containing protein [Planctomycetaceae bacterium]|nr:PepSY domain-containing protein [Planctomycetaceae bacterium]
MHLYSGLFLVPWVILYGITGAMFNHIGLFPRQEIRTVPEPMVSATPLARFPTAEQLTDQVVTAIQQAAPDHEISRLTEFEPQFTGDLMFETKDGEGQHILHIDPVSHQAWLGTVPPNLENPEVLLKEIRTLQLPDDPHPAAQAAAQTVLRESGISADNVQPLGWTKLNFIASIDGSPARITYVLKDGHVDMNRFTGEDGMPLRQFLLRMHTSHGQPPTWNGRMYWSVIVDSMAIAMVTWALSGIFMWWQLKRTRLIGAVVIVMSILTATGLWVSLQSFYATTRL